MTNEINPVVGSVSVSRGVRAPREQGPVALPSNIATLNPAVDRGEIAPVRRERLLDEDRGAPKVDIFGAIANIADGASNLIGSVSALGADNRTQQERNGERLKPLVQRLNQLNSAQQQGQISGIKAQASTALRSFIAANPDLQDDAFQLSERLLGVRNITSTQIDPEELVIQNVIDWTQNTSAGALASLGAAGLPSGQQEAFLLRKFQESEAQLMSIEESNRALQFVENDKKAFEIEAGRRVDQISLNQDKIVTDVVGTVLQDGFEITEGFSGDATLGDLREIRQTLVRDFNAEYTSANIPTRFFQDSLSETLAPIDGMINAIEQSGEDIENLARIRGRQAVLEMGKVFSDTEFAGLAAHPDFQRVFVERLIMNDSLGIEEAARMALEKIKVAPSGTIQIPKTTSGIDPNELIEPSYTQSLRANPVLRINTANNAAETLGKIDYSNPEQLFSAYEIGYELIASISAGNDSIEDEATFDKLITNNLQSFTALTNQANDQGRQFTEGLKRMFVKQFAHNVQRFNDLNATLPAGFSLKQTEDRVELDFNAEAFLEGESGTTQRVRRALNQNNLPPTLENVLKVAEGLRPFSSGSRRRDNPDPSFEGSSLGLVADNIPKLLKTVARLNKLNSSANSVPNLNEPWNKEVDVLFGAGLVNFDLEGFGFGVPTTVRQSEATSFNSEEDFLAAAEAGEIRVGQIVIVDGQRLVARFTEE